MAEELRIVPIAHIRTDFPTKFGIPRQAGIADALQGTVVFEPEFRVDDALRGIEGFSHLWLIWGFSENVGSPWTPTVRPPRLGGNVRMGVFATRSPFRPNGLGLSCVRLLSLKKEPMLGTTLLVAGADLMDGTPIYDIKPYIPYADSIPDAAGGFAPDEGRVRGSGGKARGASFGARARSAAALSGRPGTHLRYGIRRAGHPLPGGGYHVNCHRCHQQQL